MSRKQHLIDFPWSRFFANLYKGAMNADILSRAAQVAFYFSFSIFPLLFFLVSLFGLVLDSTQNLQGEMESYLHQILPWSAFVLVRDTLSEIVTSSSTGKLTIGLLVTLWSASAGVDSMRNALNAVYELRESRWWHTRKAQSVTITLLFIILIAIGMSIVFYGWQMFQTGLSAIGLHTASPVILGAIQWISTLVVMLFAFEVVYNLLPNFKQRKWLWITPGSIAAIGLWVLLTRLFALYLSYFNSYSRTYGSLAAVMILLLWLYLSAVVVMIGGTINAVYYRLRDEENVDPPDVTEKPVESSET